MGIAVLRYRAVKGIPTDDGTYTYEMDLVSTPLVLASSPPPRSPSSSSSLSRCPSHAPSAGASCGDPRGGFGHHTSGDDPNELRNASHGEPSSSLKAQHPLADRTSLTTNSTSAQGRERTLAKCNALIAEASNLEVKRVLLGGRRRPTLSHPLPPRPCPNLFALRNHLSELPGVRRAVRPTANELQVLCEGRSGVPHH